MKLLFALEPTPIIPMVVDSLETMIVLDHTEREIAFRFMDGLIDMYEGEEPDQFYHDLVSIRDSIQRTMRPRN